MTTKIDYRVYGACPSKLALAGAAERSWQRKHRRNPIHYFNRRKLREWRLALEVGTVDPAIGKP
jgi:hypothetical protein